MAVTIVTSYHDLHWFYKASAPLDRHFGMLAKLGIAHFVRGLSVRKAVTKAMQSERASALIEFAMLSPIMIGLTLGAIQLGSIYFAEAELQRVTRLAERLVMIGGAASMTQDQFKAKFCANIAALLDCGKIYISLQPQAGCASIATAPPPLTYDADGNVTTAMPFNPGQSQSVMVLQVTYLEPVLGLPMLSFASTNGFIPLYSTFVFFNEPT
jgi:Flp pilus assembly protein TadG